MFGFDSHTCEMITLEKKRERKKKREYPGAQYNHVDSVFSGFGRQTHRDHFGSPTGFFLKFSRACKSPFYLGIEVEMGVFHLEL